MEFLSVALVIVAGMAYKLVEKYLDQKATLNKGASNDALTAATEELSKKFDLRINKCFENHQIIKTEMDSMKLQYGLRNK